MSAPPDRVSLPHRGRLLLPAATAYVTALAFDHPILEAPIADPDWFAAFREASGIHGLGPYLGLRVVAGEIAPPEPMRAWLIGQVERNRTRLNRMRDELDTTLAALRRAGIDAMPIKGAAMLLSGADDLVWRSTGDLDLLVRGVSNRELDLAVAHAGYCLAAASWKHRHYGPCAPRPPLVLNDGEHPNNPRDLEIHAAVAEMFRGFRWDLTRLLLDGADRCDDVAVPNASAMALHLAVHSSISILDGQARAIQLIDLMRAIDRVGPGCLVSAAKRTGMSEHARFIYPSVTLAARESGNAACAAVASALRPFVTATMATWVERVSLYDISYPALAEGPQVDRFAIWARSPWERARMLQHRLVPSPAVLAGHAHTGSGPVTVQYLRHYRHLFRRAIALGARESRIRGVTAHD
jgi:hypothetical protein